MIAYSSTRLARSRRNVGHVTQIGLLLWVGLRRRRLRVRILRLRLARLRLHVVLRRLDGHGRVHGVLHRRGIVFGARADHGCNEQTSYDASVHGDVLNYLEPAVTVAMCKPDRSSDELSYFRKRESQGVGTVAFCDGSSRRHPHR